MDTTPDERLRLINLMLPYQSIYADAYAKYSKENRIEAQREARKRWKSTSAYKKLNNN